MKNHYLLKVKLNYENVNFYYNRRGLPLMHLPRPPEASGEHPLREGDK
jgi:hypothetical protein